MFNTTFFQVRSQYILCKRLRVPILSYPDSMKYALKDGPAFLKFGVPLSALVILFQLLLHNIIYNYLYIYIYHTRTI